MKHKSKNTLREMATLLGLKVRFVSYFSAGTHGKLLPRERRILINAHEPRCEHVFTLLHEIGHFLIHFQNAPQQRHPRFFDIHWKIKWLAEAFSTVRRYLRFIFNRKESKEWEADLWAFCAFIYFARHLGCRRDLLAFVDRHPEKSSRFYLAACGVAYAGVSGQLKPASDGQFKTGHLK